ncbi:hypothetical protein PPERSA_10768 [Pseudocohnilembus persalinus]|uniref:Transmembrane protein n=1 Tax=Pseudocohnilembus persalinus TaxID=266149 RepID=A0A0V0QDI6_PSEPJ|nr:hypothetical protein PPERSA_10768 [Pseudocohnilembus persalinus]|eukprot:KRX00269.1 hypothetical protein PPERSA_10768 [Pseudocohnilembus persalinus]
MTNSYDTKEEKNCFISYYNSAHQNTSYEYIWGTIERIILILTPTPCLIGFVFYVSYKVNEKLKGQMGNQEIYLKACITIEDKQNLKKHLYYFPITLMLLWSFLYMIRFLEICNAINDYDTTVYKVIFTISYVLCTLQGVANSLFFYQAVMENQISEQKQLKQQQEWYERDEGTISILKSSYVSSSIYESQNLQKQNSENHQNNRKQSQIDQSNPDSNY